MPVPLVRWPPCVVSWRRPWCRNSRSPRAPRPGDRFCAIGAFENWKKDIVVLHKRSPSCASSWNPRVRSWANCKDAFGWLVTRVNRVLSSTLVVTSFSPETAEVSSVLANGFRRYSCFWIQDFGKRIFARNTSQKSQNVCTQYMYSTYLMPLVSTHSGFGSMGPWGYHPSF